MPEHALNKEMPALLLRWYDRSARVLPWRENPTPYRVWVSEIMLQQTRVEAVKPYYERFLAELPTIEALANAPEEQLLKLWEGLGYYNRVRNLQKGAKQVLEEYGGELPADFEKIRKLAGIGDYTAGAISSIAFGIPVPAVDGNVLRVTSRLTASYDDIQNPAVKKRTEQEIIELIPKDRAGDFNQSLMELGATVCLPGGAPLCGECPLQEICEAHKLGVELELPVKAAKKPRRVEERTVFLITWGDAVALRRRPERGLLAGLWELPAADGFLTEGNADAQLKEWDLSPLEIAPLPDAKHIFTHVEWRMKGFLVKVDAPCESFAWAKPEELLTEFPLPSAFKTFFPHFPRKTSH